MARGALFSSSDVGGWLVGGDDLVALQQAPHLLLGQLGGGWKKKKKGWLFGQKKLINTFTECLVGVAVNGVRGRLHA